MFIVQVNICVDNDYLNIFRSLLLENVRMSLEETGCICFDIGESLDELKDETHFILYEKYTSATAFDVHLNTEHFLTFDTAVNHMLKEKKVATFKLLNSSLHQ